jgi:hypothetical protein
MQREEHDESLLAKKTTLVSAPTIYAVVNTGTAGDSVANIGFATVAVSTPTLYAIVNTGASNAGNTTVEQGTSPWVTSFSGNVTLDAGSKTGIAGNVTLSDSKTYIGLTTTTLAASPAFVGIVTVANPTSSNVGNVTLDAGSKTGIVGNITLSDPKGFIGLVTVVGSLAPAAGNVTLDPGSKTGIAGNVTLSDSKTGIGLVSIFGGSVGVTESIGTVSTVNSTATPLAGDAVFTGTSEDVKNYSTLAISIFTDKASATDGLSFQWSSDNSNWDIIENFTITANSGREFRKSPRARYFRVVYTNGNQAQAAFRLQTIFHPDSIATFNRPLDKDIPEFSEAVVVRSVIAAQRAGGSNDYLNIQATNGGNLKVSVEDMTALIASNAYIGLATVDIGTQNGVAVKGNVTLSDSKGYIGLVTVTQASSARTITGNVTLDAGSRTGIAGNVTLSDSKTYIGLTTSTLGSSPAFIGIVTVANPSSSAAGNVTLDAGSKTGIVGNVTLSDSKGFIGLTTVVQSSSARTITGNVTIDSGTITTITNPVAIKGNVTLSDSKTFIGLVTVGNTVGTTFSGNVTLDAGSRTGIVGNVTLSDSKTFIGLVTVGNTVGTTFSGNVTLDAGSRTQIAGNVTINSGTITAVTDITNPIAIKGNMTLSDSKTYIGLVTVTQANSARTITGNLTLSDPKGFIGLVTIVGSLSPAAGNITLDAGSKTGIVGNVTLSDAKTYIGLTTTTVGNAMVTVTLGTKLDAANDSVAIIGNLTLSDPKGFIGLVTVVGSLSPAAGNVTLDAGSKTGIVGNVTLSDSKGYIGLVTVTQANTARTITGNITINSGTITTLTGGGVAHDGVDSANPHKIGLKAIAHSTNPTAVAAADVTDWYANRAGIPFVIGGHPNIVSLEVAYTTAQTNAAIVTVGSGVKIVVTEIRATCDNANTVDTGVRVGLGATTTPTTTGVVLTHPGIAPGSGDSRGDGSGILAIGADNDDLRITSEVPTGGSLRILVSYYTIES